MQAVIDIGGRQERVFLGDKVKVSLPDNYGQEVCVFEPKAVIDESNITVGAQAAKYQVTAKVLRKVKGPKIVGFYYRPKTNYRRRFGHRQRYFEVEILTIEKREG